MVAGYSKYLPGDRTVAGYCAVEHLEDRTIGHRT
jgi:hypothetical protein